MIPLTLERFQEELTTSLWEGVRVIVQGMLRGTPHKSREIRTPKDPWAEKGPQSASPRNLTQKFSSRCEVQDLL